MARGVVGAKRVQFFNTNLPQNQNHAASADPAASVGMIACQFLMRKRWMSRWVKNPAFLAHKMADGTKNKIGFKKIA